jgi:hypothetical protein
MNPKRLEERRAFNDQLRARLKLVAAERGIADVDMKWIGRLRHHDLVNFVQKHKLCWAWVFCGDDLQGRLRLVAALPSGPPRMARWSPRVIQGGDNERRCHQFSGCRTG